MSLAGPSTSRLAADGDLTATIRYVGVIPNDDCTRIYVDDEGRLPTFIVPSKKAAPRRNVAQACHGFESLLGVPVTVQRPLWVEDDPTGTLRAYVLEPYGSLNNSWVPIEDVDLPGWHDCSDRLATTLRGTDGSPPWYSPGYREEVESWIQGVLEGRGEALTGPIRQVRHWTLSAVWKAESSAGSYYFKGGLPEDGEPAKTTAIARQWPDIAPVVVASDPQRGWLLTADLGGTPLSRIWDPQLWARVAVDYGRLQVDSTSFASNAGDLTPDVRSMSDYYRDAERLLTDDALRAGPSGMTEAELAALHRAADSWLAAITSLGENDDLLALDHGDFDAHQIVVVDEAIRILDWGEVGFSHPLIGIESYIRTLHEGGRLRGKSKTWPRRLAYAAARRLLHPIRRGGHDPTGRYHEQIFEAYMSVWRGQRQYQEIRQARTQMQEAFPLLRAVEYWRMTKQMPNPWEAEMSLPNYVRCYLRP